MRPSDLYREAELEVDGIVDPDRWIVRSRFIELLEIAARRCADPIFGLRLGATVDAKDFGLLAYLVSSAPTFLGAFRDIQSYTKLFCDVAEMRLSIGDRTSVLTCPPLPGLSHFGRQYSEWALAAIVNGLRRMAGPDWAPLEVTLKHAAPDDIAPYARYLGPRVSFGREANGIVVDSAILGERPTEADSRLHAILKARADSLVNAYPGEDDLTKSLRAFVARALPRGYPAIEDAAGEVRVSVRTLQRRLRAVGTDYSRLVDDIRRDMARQLLDDDSRSFKEIAHLLGYSQPSAFNRAWRRWTGSTPQAYRNRSSG